MVIIGEKKANSFKQINNKNEQKKKKTLFMDTESLHKYVSQTIIFIIL